jgi:hypothetical protein
MSAHDNTAGVIAGHETRDASVRMIVGVLVLLAVGAGLVCAFVYGVFVYLSDHPLTTTPPNPLVETAREQFPPQPRLQEHPAIELQQLRGEEDQILNTYGWTDKKAGIVRIPIDRAMELAMQRGFATKAGSK